MMFHKLYKLTLFLFVIGCFAFQVDAKTTNNQELQVSLRAIGHEFLLQLNDSTSRVLPIKKINGRYAVQFERKFSFEPNLLFSTVFNVIEKYNISETFIVEVEQCITQEVIYSFKTSIRKDGNIIPCKQRVLPNDCYIFYFTVIENTNEEIVKNNATSLYNFTYIFIFLAITLSTITYYKKRRTHLTLKSSVILIGKYRFNQKKMLLSIQGQSVELSNKEASLLFLLYSNENKTLEREYILNEVWGDEGSYIGRTLDVYISKLRKKLELDSSLKIINVRGIGYRFVING
ncbi:response regulator transcription factor [Lutibacter sp.]|uniref:winged helix-turn-helix domain-containing protein n=1 Tax=Lutibacter sp. TaxID=1925666 RepID=UPI00262A0E19|nr:response regulator transcription factor [uncultured Lutibacter sp.]